MSGFTDSGFIAPQRVTATSFHDTSSSSTIVSTNWRHSSSFHSGSEKETEIPRPNNSFKTSLACPKDRTSNMFGNQVPSSWPRLVIPSSFSFALVETLRLILSTSQSGSNLSGLTQDPQELKDSRYWITWDGVCSNSGPVDTNPLPRLLENAPICNYLPLFSSPNS